jgi:hypothetical protein
MSALENRIVELEADNTYLAKTLLDMGEKVVLFVDEFEDEGDRIYFGSTNHAEYLRDLRQKIDGLWFDRELAEKAAKGRDLYADLREVRESNRELVGTLQTLRGVLSGIAEHPDGDELDTTAAAVAVKLIDATLAAQS